MCIDYTNEGIRGTAPSGIVSSLKYRLDGFRRTRIIQLYKDIKILQNEMAGRMSQAREFWFRGGAEGLQAPYFLNWSQV